MRSNELLEYLSGRKGIRLIEMPVLSGNTIEKVRSVLKELGIAKERVSSFFMETDKISEVK